MTHTPDSIALLTAIRSQPDEDTPRLIYADAIEDTDPERAELVRIQVGGFSQMKCTKPYPYKDKLRCSIRLDHYTGYERANQWCEVCYKTTRERELLAAHADRWRKGPVCGMCSGKGGWKKIGAGGLAGRDPQCPHCCGTGDAGGLMRKMNYTHEGQTRWGSVAYGLDELVRVTYHRGMKRVECRAEDVWENELVRCEHGSHFDNPKRIGWKHRTGCPQCFGRGKVLSDNWRPTPWALAVCRHHPDVTSFAILDGEQVPDVVRNRHKNLESAIVLWIWDHIYAEVPHG